VVTTHLPRVEVGHVGKSAPKSGCRLEWYSSPRARLAVIHRVGLLVGEVRAKPPGNVGDGADKMTLVMVRCRSRVNLAVVQCHCRPMLVMALPSPAGDDVAESTLAIVMP
jgi:hypothetical protein